MSTAIVPTEPKELEHETSAVVQAARKITINDQESYEAAGAFVKDTLPSAIERIEAKFHLTKHKEDTNKSWKWACELYNMAMKPIAEAKSLVTQKCRVYEDEQRRIQQENQRKAEEEARKREEEERLQEAVAAEEAGASPEEVEAVMETPMPMAPVKAAPTFNRVKGVTRERPYSAQVTSKLILVRHIAQNPQFLNLLEPHMPSLNALAKAQGERMQIPGVRAGRF